MYFFFFFFFKQKTAYEIMPSLVGSEMCIRDRIDNASQDRTVSLIESRYPEVRLIKSKENLGFGRANNIGMKIALKEGYDAVFLLNQDAWIDAKVLGELSELSRSHPRYGILSPIHLTGSGEKLEQGFAGYSNLSNLEEVKKQELKIRQETNGQSGLIPVSYTHLTLPTTYTG